MRYVYPVVLLLIFNSTLVFGDYNRDSAVSYATQWWDGRNPEYQPSETADCANFVSQCLIAGGILDKEGRLTQCRRLGPTLDSIAKSTEVVKTRQDPKPRYDTSRVPSYFRKGDVAIFHNTDGNHAVIVVKNTGANVTFAAHNSDRYDTLPDGLETNIDFYFNASNALSVTVYHIDDTAPMLRLKKTSNGAEISNGGTSNETEIKIEAEDDLEGGGIREIQIRDMILPGTLGQNYDQKQTFPDFPHTATINFSGLQDGVTYRVDVMDKGVKVTVVSVPLS